MFLSHALYVSLIIFSLAVLSLAASRIGKESIDELDKLYIRSPLRSTSSIEEGEIGYSSDEFADELEEGEIRDTEQSYDEQALPDWNAIEQDDEGDQATSSSGWQDWQHWGPPDSSTWEHCSEPDWEEGEIRDYPDSEMWQHDDDVGAEGTTTTADYEDSMDYSHHDAPHRSVSSFYDSTTTTVEETAKRHSLLSDILSRPAMPFIPPDNHKKKAADRIDRPRLSLSSAASLIKSAFRGTSGDTPTSRYRDDAHTRAETSHQAGSSRKVSKAARDSASNLSFDFDDTRMTVKAKQRRQRAIFERIWRDKGISYDMSPQEVALGVAKIKIEYGHDLSIGTMASVKVQSETDEDYFNQFQLATRSYSRRLSQEKNKLKTEAKYFHFTEWEK